MHRTTTFLPSIRWQDHIGIIPFIVHPDKCQITKPRNYLHKVIKAHRVDFISGTHLFVQKAVVETLSALSLTPHLYAILVADLGVEPSSPLSESGVQAVIPIGNIRHRFGLLPLSSRGPLAAEHDLLSQDYIYITFM